MATVDDAEAENLLDDIAAQISDDDPRAYLRRTLFRGLVGNLKLRLEVPASFTITETTP